MARLCVRHDYTLAPVTPDTSSAAMDALATALLPYLLPRLRAELALEREETKLMTAHDTPVPRATMAACRCGHITGAKKVHRQWTFTLAAWKAYVEARGLAPNKVAVVDRELGDLDELRAEVGLKRRRTGGSENGPTVLSTKQGCR